MTARRIRFPIPWGIAILLSLAVPTLWSCVPPTPEVEPPVEPPEAFSMTGTEAMPSRWWTAFDDPVLDDLVDEALRGNFDLAAAWERLRQAEAVAEQAGAPLWPEVDASLDFSTRRGSSEQSAFQPDEELRLGAAASYEVDLWGRVRSSLEAERLRVRATRADYRAAALSLSAEVARTYFQLAEARRQVEILASQLEAAEQVETLVETRFEGGQVRGVDVLRQRRLVESTREQLYVAESEQAVLEHLLAVLVGRAPQDFELDQDDHSLSLLPPLPPLPEAGLPAELVERRPDVAAAFLRLRAADRDLASAMANRYPRLTLSASVSTTDDQAGDLFDDWIRTLAGGLLAPIFRGGELAAAVDEAEAVRRQRIYEYGQANLEAWREVEDALVRETQQAKRVGSLERQLELSRQAYDQLRRSYLNGVGNYVDVLLAQTDSQQLERDLVTAQRLLREQRVSLYRALAGGFETPREQERDPDESADQATQP